MEFFTVEKINERITCIRSASGELMYLLQGEARALLMDTSVGVYGLRAIVDSLTDLPYDVVITHGHIDHAMGAPEFKDKKIYMSLKDLDVYHSMQDVEERFKYTKYSGCIMMPITAEDFLPPEEIDFIDLTDGMEFDLGGLTVEMIAVPGHTQGSMALLVKEERILILGDAGNSFTFLFGEYSSTVTDYRKMIQGLQKRVEGRIDAIYLCHHYKDAPLSLLPELVEVCDDILAGNVADEPFVFMDANNAKIAKAQSFSKETGPRREDGKFANIVYDKI